METNSDSRGHCAAVEREEKERKEMERM